MLNDFLIGYAVVLMISMAGFGAWMLIENRRAKKAGRHEYFLHDEEEDWG